MNLDILFLGRLFPREKEAEIKNKMKTGMQEAANALQWNIIDGMEANDCGSIKILNYLPVDSYPKGYTDKSIEGFYFEHTKKYKCDDFNVACTNLSIIKQFANIIPFKKEVKKWIKSKNDAQKVIVMYTANTMFLSLAKFVKKFASDIKICCIIADIPEFAAANNLNGIRKIYNSYQAGKCASLYKYIDKFVLLTEQMAEKLEIKVPYIVVEGVAPEQSYVIDSVLADKFKNEKYIFYSGTLNYKFGIAELLEAFHLIPDTDVKLVICGFGQAEKQIRDEMKIDSRIEFLGKVDRTDAIALQRTATVLVNPRQNNEEFTKYSFPSKTMEYLSSGVPLVAYKLDGIPDEYDAHIKYVPDNDAESLADKIISVLNMGERERTEIGKSAQNFVFNKKNNIIQSKKILDFVSKI